MSKIRGNKIVIAVSIDKHLETFFNSIPRTVLASRSKLINGWLLEYSMSMSGSR